MVIQEPTTIPLVKGFSWFFTEEELIVEGNKTFVQFDIDGAQWLPANPGEAYRWYLYSPNAASIRAKSGLLHIVQVANISYADTARALDGEPEPADWLYTEMLDISERLDLEPEYTGYVVEGPISAKFSVYPRHTIHPSTKQVGAIYSNMMSREEIEMLSGDRVIRHADVLESQRQTTTQLPGKPKPIFGGVSDLRLGATTPDENCMTCGLPADLKGEKEYSCPGHFGRINLVTPVPNYLYLTGDIDNSPLIKTLKYVCLNCSKVVLPDEYLNPLIEQAKEVMYENGMTSPDGYKIIMTALNDAYNAYYVERKRDLGPYQLTQGGPVATPLTTKVNHCPHCNEYSPILQFKMTFGMGRRAEFFPMQGKRPRDQFPRSRPYAYDVVHAALSEVPNDHALAMAFNTEIDTLTDQPRSHPRYFFWEVFPIAPNSIRPPQESPTGALETNDLTQLYVNVVKANQALMDLGTDSQKFRRSESILFKACTQALSTQTAFGTPSVALRFGGSGTTTDALKGVYDRIKPPGQAKNHIRRINQSKVSEHTIYSVITPNPDLRLDEVGIPRGACIRLTVAEQVTAENIERLRDAVITGYPYERRGAGGLTKADENRYFGGAKFIQQAGNKARISLEDEPNSRYNPFRVEYIKSQYLMEKYQGDSSKMIRQKDPEALNVWYQEILRGIRASYRGVEDRTNMYTAIEEAKRDFKYEYAKDKRRGLAAALKIGDTVHRGLRSGDMIIFTRAPALHRQNVMAGKVRPLDQKAISFNPTICVPFNADYDGDTMRCFVPQSPEAIQECKDILDVNKQIMHSRYGRPTIASDQDETSGAYLLTFPNKSKLTYKGKDEDGNDITITYNAYQKLDKDERKKFKGPHGTFDGRIGYDKNGHVYFTKQALIEMLGLVYTRDDEGNVKYLTELPEPDFKKYYTGKSVVSMFIPEGINCDWKDSTGEEVSIRNGQLLRGTLDAKGVKNGSMVLGAAFIYHFNYELGIRKLAEFIDHINRLFFAAHLYVGYTIGIEDISLSTPEFLEKKTQLYNEASEKIEVITKAFFNKTLDELPEEYFDEFSRHWLTYDPYGWMEFTISKVTEDFDDEIIKLTKELQGTANQMNIAVVSGARAKNLNIQQMSGAYGQVRVGGTRLLSGAKVGRLLSHYKEGDYSGEAFAFTPDSYADGFRPEHYFLASIAGRRSNMESSMGAIQDSGYLEHRLKRACENLMIDERGYLVNLRLGKILSFQTGEDGLQPFHARGPDNKNGYSLSLQPLFLGHVCKHNKTLFDKCDTCQVRTPYRKTSKLSQIPANMRNSILSKLEVREIEDPTALFSRAHEYYQESKARPGEMIGATGAANVGEPVTQAGLRAFHGGGKGTTPTIDRIVQILDLSQSEIAQPSTRFYLLPEYNNEQDAQHLANFCSTLYMSDITKLIKYQPQERGIDVMLDYDVIETFEIDPEFILKLLSFKGKKEKPKFDVTEIEGGLRIRTTDVPEYIDIDSYLLVLREFVEKYQIHGLINGGRAFTDFSPHPMGGEARWQVVVNGPETPSPGRANPMMENAAELMGQYYDESLTTSNDPFWAAHEYGLEAALACVKEIFNNQMNSDSGLGELDIRYIDALIDNMGSTGYLAGLAKSGHMVSKSTSLIGGIGGEDPGLSLRAHPIMGTVDRLEGMVEAITAGKDLVIGKAYIEKKLSKE
jgi:DNA-directed RNA polymerase subunit A'